MPSGAEAAMDAEDADVPSQSVLDFIRKEQKKGIDKQLQILKKQMRKNYSGDGTTILLFWIVKILTGIEIIIKQILMVEIFNY